jgi:hypothetical protein
VSIFSLHSVTTHALSQHIQNFAAVECITVLSSSLELIPMIFVDFN